MIFCCRKIALGQQQLNVLRGNRQGGLLNRLLRNPFASKEKGNSDTVTTVTGEKIDTKKVYELTTTDGQSNYTIADCCHPIPGDDVVGYVDDDNKVVVHKLDCPVAMRLKSSYGSRLVQTRWETKSEKFLAAIRVEGIDRMGILQEIIYIISTTMAINMRRLNISADDGLFRCDLVVLVEDANVITNLCKRLKRVKGVKIAERT